MLFELIKRYKWLFVLATSLSIVSALLSIGIISLLSKDVTRLSTGSELHLSVGLFFAAMAGVILFGTASQYILSRLGAIAVFDLRSVIVRRVLGTSYEQIEKIGGHRVYATLTNDITNISNGVRLLPGFIFGCTTSVLCLGYMYYLSWQLLLVVVAMLALIVAVAAIILTIGMKLQGNLRQLDDELFLSFKGLVNGAKELNLSSFRKKHFYQTSLNPVITGIRHITVKVEMAFVLLSQWTSSLIFMVLAVIIFGTQYLFPDLPTETVVSFIFTVMYTIDPLAKIIEMLSQFSAISVATNKVNNLQLAESVEPKEGATAHQPKLLTHQWATMKVEDFCFTYRATDDAEESFSIGPVNLSVNRGDIVFLTGGNGSGKTTFAKALIGLYSATSGRVLFDDKDLGPDLLKENISTIFADFHLFDHVLDSKGESCQDEFISGYLKKFKLEERVTSTEGRLSNINLSQGQKRRLAMLMSLSEDKSIYLFDEWASDQDPYFREYFYNQLLPELSAKNKTVFVISHDDQYFHTADLLVKFDRGVIVEERGKENPKKIVNSFN